MQKPDLGTLQELQATELDGNVCMCQCVFTCNCAYQYVYTCAGVCVSVCICAWGDDKVRKGLSD